MDEESSLAPSRLGRRKAGTFSQCQIAIEGGTHNCCLWSSLFSCPFWDMSHAQNSHVHLFLPWLREPWQYRHTYLCYKNQCSSPYTCCLLRVPIACHLVLEVAVEEISGG